MRKKILPILALGTFGLASYAATYMVVTKSDGTVVEYNVEDVDNVSYRRDSVGNGGSINPDLGCDGTIITDWDLFDPTMEKNCDGSISGGQVIVVYGSNLSNITSISFAGKEVDLQPTLMQDDKIVFEVPEGINQNCIAHITTASCPEGFDTEILKVYVAPPCVAMCDNEFAVKTMKVVGNSLYAPLTAKFWDGKDYTIEASTEDGSIVIDDPNHATIYIPKGVADGGHIVFSNLAGETITDFIYRDTRNMLITHDDEDYLNKFIGQRPDQGFYDYNTDDYVKWEERDEVAKTYFRSENTNGDFSIFWSQEFTSWTYESKSETAVMDSLTPKYPTPFGVFSESIVNGETDFNDYAIKFEVFVSEESPMIGNGLVIGFFDYSFVDSRAYCAFWQPSRVYFARNENGEWEEAIDRAYPWTSGGDWMTITIPMDEIKYNFQTKSYLCSPQNNRVIVNPDGLDSPYTAYGDDENGLPFFDKYGDKLREENLLGKRSKMIQSIGMVYDLYDQPTLDNQPYIAVDNLRIVPRDNNGGMWRMTDWGVPTRDFYTKPVMSCK